MPSCPRAAVGLLAAAPSCAPLAELAARERPVEHAVERLRLWICGRSALPTGCASPASRASSEGEEMLAFTHIPTGTTVNKAIDVEDLKSRGAAARATAMTTIRADIDTGGATP